jgi:hypothetical protein
MLVRLVSRMGEQEEKKEGYVKEECKKARNKVTDG